MMVSAFNSDLNYNLVKYTPEGIVNAYLSLGIQIFTLGIFENLTLLAGVESGVMNKWGVLNEGNQIVLKCNSLYIDSYYQIRDS